MTCLSKKPSLLDHSAPCESLGFHLYISKISFIKAVSGSVSIQLFNGIIQHVIIEHPVSYVMSSSILPHPWGFLILQTQWESQGVQCFKVVSTVCQVVGLKPKRELLTETGKPFPWELYCGLPGMHQRYHSLSGALVKQYMTGWWWECNAKNVQM